MVARARQRVRKFDLAALSPTAFEEYVGHVLRALKEGLRDFKIEHRKLRKGANGEYEIDLEVSFRALGPTRFVVLVECKHHRARVKRDVVQVLHDRIRETGAHKGMVFSSAGFQSGAIEYAGTKGIALVQIQGSGGMSFVTEAFRGKPRGTQTLVGWLIGRRTPTSREVVSPIDSVAIRSWFKGRGRRRMPVRSRVVRIPTKAQNLMRRLVSEDPFVLRASTLPIVFFSGAPSAATMRSVGTCVPVSIGRRLFLLTAGHVVAECKETKETRLGIDLFRSSPPHQPVVVSSGAMSGPGGDFGYLELAWETTSMLTSKSVLPVPLARCDADPASLSRRRSGEVFVLAGFPGVDIRANDHGHSLSCCLFVIDGAQIRRREAPKRNQRLASFELSVPPASMRSLGKRKLRPTVLRELNGVSGGGFWRVVLDEKRISGFRAELLAIHAGGFAERGRIAHSLVEVPIVKHLALIANDHPELRATILKDCSSARQALKKFQQESADTRIA